MSMVAAQPPEEEWSNAENVDMRYICYLLLVSMFVFLYKTSYANDVDCENVQQNHFEEVKTKLIEYRNAYNNLKITNLDLFNRFFSEGFRSEYDKEDFEDRFPSYLFVRVLKLPTEVIKLNNIRRDDCGEQFDTNKFICLKIVGKNYYKVLREITVRYKNEHDSWYIDYLSFKSLSNHGE